jgi:MoaA/NifB/PqqE/SkfB family radical SAM enzyme
MHPQFSEMVRSVKEKNLKLAIATNGTMIKKVIDDLRHFDKINVSLDGVDYEHFRKTRSGTREQYDDIIAGIRLLRDSGIPFNISFLLFEETMSDVKNILDFAQKMKPERLQFESGNPHNSQDWTPLLAGSPTVNNFLREIFKRNDYPFSIRMPIIFDPSSELFQRQPCPQLWQVIIGPTGNIAYCCHLQDKPEIGNIFKGYNFNSPLMVQFRKAMIEHKFPIDCLYCKNRFFELFSLYFENFSCFFNSGEKNGPFLPPTRNFYQKLNYFLKTYE